MICVDHVHIVKMISKPAGTDGEMTITDDGVAVPARATAAEPVVSALQGGIANAGCK